MVWLEGWYFYIQIDTQVHKIYSIQTLINGMEFIEDLIKFKQLIFERYKEKLIK